VLLARLRHPGFIECRRTPTTGDFRMSGVRARPPTKPSAAGSESAWRAKRSWSVFGKLVMEAVRAFGAELVPVDSEHNAPTNACGPQSEREVAR